MSLSFFYRGDPGVSSSLSMSTQRGDWEDPTRHREALPGTCRDITSTDGRARPYSPLKGSGRQNYPPTHSPPSDNN